MSPLSGAGVMNTFPQVNETSAAFHFCDNRQVTNSSLQNAVIKVVPTSNLTGLSRGLNEFTQKTANGVWLNAQVITDQGVTQGNTRTYIICVMTVEAGLHTEGTEGKKKSFPAVPICGYEGRSANRILWGPAHWG